MILMWNTKKFYKMKRHLNQRRKNWSEDTN